MSLKTLNDKMLHAIGGAILMLLGLWLSGPMAGLGLVILAALAREAYNRRSGGPFDWKDIAATIGGGLLAIAAVDAVIGLPRV